MRILILSFYYEPDLCAGSFRTTALTNELKKKLSASDTLDIITTCQIDIKVFQMMH